MPPRFSFNADLTSSVNASLTNYNLSTFIERMLNNPIELRRRCQNHFLKKEKKKLQFFA
jgi:hypothetical protein